ncbi:hypothetical protein DFH08DRAFT_796545 [Mycena albidolilacea]|uniref:Uncharacterized protein n=1 Tax=Mycena albidolilacea TaxID=1033008 RepID=A0AAD7F4L7_9AGAR|nr:hypothetical protein DFH08DRAFT_796545 [Mycena albidolilacea]
MSANSQQASLKIKFVIIGDGIVGLTSVKALRDGGHEVVIIERISQDKHFLVCMDFFRTMPLRALVCSKNAIWSQRKRIGVESAANCIVMQAQLTEQGMDTGHFVLVPYQNSFFTPKNGLLKREILPSEIFPKWKIQGKVSNFLSTSGSMLPGVLDRKSVTTALTGANTMVLKLEGRNISILRGELVRLITCLIISDADDRNTVLYTDHLNSVRLVDDSKTAVDKVRKRRCDEVQCGPLGGRDEEDGGQDEEERSGVCAGGLGERSESGGKRKRFPGPVHNAKQSEDASERNRGRDAYDAREGSANNQQAPIPAFFMDKFTFYTPDDGWIESNIRNYTEKSQSSTASERLGDGHQQRMSLALYDSKSPPEYPYTHAYSPSAVVHRLRRKLDDPRCRHGCDAIEDQHHLFVKCERYAGWRTSATEEIHTRTENT